jgi:hypothetical protein
MRTAAGRGWSSGGRPGSSVPSRMWFSPW